MKKIALSLFVVAVFIIYSLQQRHETSQPVVAPAATNTSNTPTNSGSSSTNPTTTSNTSTATYKDGQYTGDSADAFYGNIQVKVIVSGGKISDVQFLQYPNDRENSVRINTEAMPYLRQEAIQAQSAHIDGVSGATDTSQAFVESLQSALNQAV